MNVLHKIITTALCTVICLMTQQCIPSYKLNASSIDYNTTKTMSIEPFTNRAAYQWGPMASMFNNTLSDVFVRQTKLKQQKRDGDLQFSGEITGYDQTNKSVSSDGYSSMVQLKMTVHVKFVNNKKHEDDFDKQFTASREYESSLQLSAVQEDLVQQMIDEIVDQIFNASVAKW